MMKPWNLKMKDEMVKSFVQEVFPTCQLIIAAPRPRAMGHGMAHYFRGFERGSLPVQFIRRAYEFELEPKVEFEAGVVDKFSTDPDKLKNAAPSYAELYGFNKSDKAELTEGAQPEGDAADQVWFLYASFLHVARCRSYRRHSCLVDWSGGSAGYQGYQRNSW